MKSNQNKKPSVQKVATERIDELFAQAEEAFEIDSKLSDRYIRLARKIALKHKTPFKKEQKMHVCKKCFKYLKPGVNSRLRVVKGRVIIMCQSCKNIRRFVYK